MEYKENNTEKAILEAALDEFADKGLTGSRTTEIAQRAGVTHAMLHYYFRTKEMLFDKVVNNKIQDICSSIFPAFIDESLPLLERITKGMSLHFDFLKENRKLPSLFIRIFSTGGEYVDQLSVVMREGMSSSLQSLQTELDKAGQDGSITKIDAVMLLSDIISLNVMPFIVWPMFSKVMDIDEAAEDAFFMRKKEENIRTIMKRLMP